MWSVYKFIKQEWLLQTFQGMDFSMHYEPHNKQLMCWHVGLTALDFYSGRLHSPITLDWPNATKTFPNY